MGLGVCGEWWAAAARGAIVTEGSWGPRGGRIATPLAGGDSFGGRRTKRGPGCGGCVIDGWHRGGAGRCGGLARQAVRVSLGPRPLLASQAILLAHHRLESWAGP